MLNARVEQAGGAGSLVLEGELIIDHAEELRRFFVEALESAGHLVLNIENVRKVDLFGLQVLCSAHRSARQANRELRLFGRQPEAFRNAVQQSGFGNHARCNVSNFCPWHEK